MNRIRKMSCILAVVASVVLALLLSLDRAAAGVPLSNLGVEVSNQPAGGVPLGTTITYQGSLTDNGAPANGAYDFEFRLYDAASGGVQVETAVTVNDLLVTNGLFTAALDFGDAFEGIKVWLEIGVRAGSSTGAYTALAPRQPLSAAPYALGLRPGAVISNSLTGPALTLASSGDGLTVDHAGGDGLYVCSTGSETSCSPTGFNNGLEVGRAEHNGVSVQAAGNNGVFVNSVGLDGLYVNHAGGDGIFVCSTGNQTDCTPSGYNNGLEVGRAENHGVRIDSAGLNGLAVASAGYDGVHIASAGGNGMSVDSAGADGVYIGSTTYNGVIVNTAGDNGVLVNSADLNGMRVITSTYDGVHVDHAGGDGIFVCSTGNQTSCTPSDSNNGLEVGSAGGYGVYVGSAGLDGVYVGSASFEGVYVDSTVFHGIHVNSAGLDGFRVFSAGDNGLDVKSANYDGVQVYSAGNDGVDVTGNNLAGYFYGDIQVTGSCTGCLLATFAVNTGSDALQPGDLVTIQGTRLSGVDSVPMLMEVAKAGAGQAIVGVVEGWAELVTEEEPRPTEIGLRLVPREGAAEPGQYVTMIIYGSVQVPVSKLADGITPGQKLALDGDGHARALQTVTMEGVQLAESAPTIGIALSEPDESGMVWVLFNP